MRSVIGLKHGNSSRQVKLKSFFFVVISMAAETF